MKKLIKIIFAFLLILTIPSCTKKEEKFLLRGNLSNETLVSVDNYTLKGMIENEESFVLVVLLSTCSTCENYKTSVLNPFIKETHSTIYSIDLTDLQTSDNYENKPYAKVAPTTFIYNKGDNVATLKYENGEKEFSDLDSFKGYMSNYVITPRLIEISEIKLDEKIQAQESFVLYIGWNKCGDCSMLEREVLNKYLLNNELSVNFYYLESDPYRINKPKEEPVLPENANADQIEEYNIQKQYWDMWINFTKKYNFNSFRNGRVPTLQYYENGIMKNMIVYNNDVVENGVVVDSYYDELDGKSISIEELLNTHNKKVEEFLNLYK